MTLSRINTNVLSFSTIAISALALVALAAGQRGTSRVLSSPAISRHSAALPVAEAAQAGVSSQFGKLPRTFEPNVGQGKPDVQFLSRGTEATLCLSPTQSSFHLLQQDRSYAVVTSRLLGASIDAAPLPGSALPGRVNYLTGAEPAKWRLNVPTYASVRYHGVYKGIDLVYRDHGGQLEYDFHVAPAADPKAIRMGLSGVSRVEIDAAGDLRLSTESGQLVQRRPTAYQEIRGIRRPISARFALAEQASGPEVSFEVGEYDPSLPLVIDPVIEYNFGIHGSGADVPYAIAVDSSGSAYVTGRAVSANFPLVNPGQATLAGASDAFIAKLNPSGTSLVYSTYLGGSGSDEGLGIALDSQSQACIVGTTTSADFPTTAGVVGASLRGASDAFVARLSVNGSTLVSSTYLGGAGNEKGVGIAVGSTDAAFVAGSTNSTDFPVTPGAVQSTAGGQGDAFATSLPPSGAALLWSTFLGGSSADSAAGIAVNNSGDTWVAGTTISLDFPTIDGVFQTELATDPDYLGFYATDVFVSRIAAGGASLVYSTYVGGASASPWFGGPGRDTAGAIAVDVAGNAYVTGSTNSVDFPLTAGAYRTGFTDNYGYQDAFVLELTPSGTDLVFSTYLGGQPRVGDGGPINDDDFGRAIAVATDGTITVAGQTANLQFPLKNPAYNRRSGSFVTRFQPGGGSLDFSTIVPGDAYGVAIDSEGSAYVGGAVKLRRLTGNSGPTTPSSLTATHNGSSYVDLAWQDNSNNELAFEIEGLRAEIQFPNTTFVTLKGKSSYWPRDVPITYRVRATNDGGDSAWSNTATIYFLSQPSNLEAKPKGSSSVDLSWTHPISGSVRFKVRRNGVGLLATTDVGVTTFHDSNPPANQKLTYSVSAILGSEESLLASVSTAVAAAPTNFKAVQEGTVVHLSMTDASTMETEFEIWRNSGSGFNLFARLPSTTTASTGTVIKQDDTIDLMGNYRYKARAQVPYGYTDFTPEVRVPLPVPAAPSNLAATTLSDTRINLAWTDNSNNESGFKIERKIHHGTYAQVATVGANVTTLSNGGLSPSTTYVYRVRAYNKYGPSDYSNEAFRTTAPAAPSGLTLTVVSKSQINLAWTDNSSNENGFKIERKSGADAFAQMATVGANVTTLSNTRLTPSTSYTYRVRAFNANGHSVYSSERSATTYLPPSDLTLTVLASTQFDVSWIDYSPEETSFRIKRKTGSGSYVQSAAVGANETSYSNIGLSPSTSYQPVFGVRPRTFPARPCSSSGS